MALNSGKKIARRSWDAIPMPDTVIDRVNVLGNDQPEDLVFTDRLGRQIGDVETPGVPTTLDEGPEEASLPGVPVPEAHVELPGVDIGGNEASPIEIHENENDLDRVEHEAPK